MRFPGATTDEQRAVVDSLATFAAREKSDARADRLLVHPNAGWQGVLSFGLLDHAEADDPSACADLVVACEALARFGIVVPIADACAIYPVLPADLRARVTAGSATCAVAFGDPPSAPWGAVADVLVTIRDERSAVIAEVVGHDSANFGGALPWGFVRPGAPVATASSAVVLALHRLLSAATLCGLSRRMLEGACEYVRERRQFGRALAEFQGVRHPLADSHAATAGAFDHALLVAARRDSDIPAAGRALDAARQAALLTTYACQQVYGAMGYVVEGPMGAMAFVVRDLVLAEPRLGPEEGA